MYYNYKRALAELRRRQDMDRPLLLEAGINEEDISELFRFERRQLDRDVKFYLKLDGYMELDVEHIEAEPCFELDVLD